jgi:hypothetical protein
VQGLIPVILQAANSTTTTQGIPTLLPGISPVYQSYIIAGFIGYLSGYLLKHVMKLGFGLIILFVFLYFVNNSQFPASLISEFIPFVKDIATQVYGLISPGGYMAIILWAALAFVAYRQYGVQGPITTPEQ